MAYKKSYKLDDFGALVCILALLGFLVAAGYGYIHNIISLFQADGFSGMMVARAIGVFMAPLGVVLGYF